MQTYSKKICLLGDFAVGKTSLVRRFIYNRFDDQYISTIGVKVSRKTVVLPTDEQIAEVKLMVWDLAGSQTFNTVTANYLRGSSGAILVCDLTRPETLPHLTGYADQLREMVPDVQLVIAANKADLVDEQRITIDEIKAYVAEMNVPYFLTSAKGGNQVETLFRLLANMVL